MKVLINSKTNIVLFKHMNQRIVDGYKRKGIIPTMREHQATFETTYGVKVDYSADTGIWKHMEFPTEQDYTMAVLKWL